MSGSLAGAPPPEHTPRLASRLDGAEEGAAAEARGSPRETEIDADRAREELAPRAVGSDGPLDPMFQILVPMTPRSAPALPAAGAPPDPLVAASSAPPVDQLLSKLVRRVAWSGNGRTGSARLELGAGALEGATLTVHADEGVVRVSLDLPPGVDGAAWRDRIVERLGARGLRLEAVEIT